MRMHDSLTTHRAVRASLGALMTMGAMLALSSWALAAPPVITPATTDHHYASRPVISGLVRSVTEHELVVDTEQGETITLMLDTRTVVPSDLTPGMAMRTEFHVLDNGAFYAKRVTPIREGMNPNRLIAYSRTGPGEELRYASTGEIRYASDDPTLRTTTAYTGTSPVRRPASSLHVAPATLEYKLATEPLIFGRVTSVTDHEVVVQTERGERIALAMDSRTVVPVDLAPGMVMRADFKVLKSGDYYARRITPMDAALFDDSHMAVVEDDYAPASGDGDTHYDAVTADNPNGVVDSDADAVVAQNTTDETATDEALPQTASRQPALALAALLALSGAGALWLRRRAVRA